MMFFGLVFLVSFLVGLSVWDVRHHEIPRFWSFLFVSSALLFSLVSWPHRLIMGLVTFLWVYFVVGKKGGGGVDGLFIIGMGCWLWFGRRW